MPTGPILIFDKSSLEGLNLDEAVLLDNFYMSNITPLFFVECLADLEKVIRSKSTPEQLVGSLADRTPEAQGNANVHHMSILHGELRRKFDMKKVLFRPLLAGGKPVQLGDKKGVVFQRSPEQEALERWTKREFLDVERNIARQWRRSLTAVDFAAMVKSVMDELGRWRKPASLQDARQMWVVVVVGEAGALFYSDIKTRRLASGGPTAFVRASSSFQRTPKQHLFVWQVGIRISLTGWPVY